MITDTLKSILDENETKVYIAALEIGTATTAQIAKKAELPRSSCYLILDELEKKGLISRTTKNKKSFVVAEPPEKLVSHIDSKRKKLRQTREEVQEQLPELQAIYNKSTLKPKVRYYEGFESMKNLYFQILDECKDEATEYLATCQGDPDKSAGLSRDPEYIQLFIKRLKKEKIRSREILEDMKSNRVYKERHESPTQQILLAPQIKSEPNKTAHFDKFIWNDKVCIFNNQKDWAILIEDPFFAENERISFNVLWNALESGVYKY